MTVETARLDMEKTARDESASVLKRIHSKPMPTGPPPSGPRDRLAANATTANAQPTCDRDPPKTVESLLDRSRGARGSQGRLEHRTGERELDTQFAQEHDTIQQSDGAFDLEGESDDDDNETEIDGVYDRINPTLKTNCAKFLLTNARSLIQKTDALTKAFESLGLDFACVTETWFKGGKALKDSLVDIEGASGIRFVHKSRDGRRAGHGVGVAIAFNTGTCNFKERKLRNVTAGQEIVCAYGRIAGSRRPFVIFSIYIPPKTNAEGRRLIAEALTAGVADMSSVLNNPAVFIGGDFNHACVADALKDVGAFTDIATGPTRGTTRLDIIYTNVGQSIRDVRVLPPSKQTPGPSATTAASMLSATLGRTRTLSGLSR